MRRTTSTKRVAAAVVAAVGTTLLAHGAHADPPPPGEAGALVAEVEDAMAVAATSAHAGSNGEASGSPVRVEPVAGEMPRVDMGGTQRGEGASQGSLADTADTPVGRVAVAPWTASVDETPDGTSSSAHAAVLWMSLADAIRVEVLSSRSASSWGARTSRAATSSDGATAEVRAGEAGPDLGITVLHAETSSEGDGHGDVWVASVGDDRFLTSDDAGDRCGLPVGPLAFSCLSARAGGGDGSAAVAATGVDANGDGDGGADLLRMAVGTVGSSSGAATPDVRRGVVGSPAPTGTDGTDGAPRSLASTATGTGGGGLAGTGAGGTALPAAALALVALGAVLMVLARSPVARRKA